MSSARRWRTGGASAGKIGPNGPPKLGEESVRSVCKCPFAILTRYRRRGPQGSARIVTQSPVGLMVMLRSRQELRRRVAQIIQGRLPDPFIIHMRGKVHRQGGSVGVRSPRVRGRRLVGVCAHESGLGALCAALRTHGVREMATEPWPRRLRNAGESIGTAAGCRVRHEGPRMSQGLAELRALLCVWRESRVPGRERARRIRRSWRSSQGVSMVVVRVSTPMSTT